MSSDTLAATYATTARSAVHTPTARLLRIVMKSTVCVPLEVRRETGRMLEFDRAAVPGPHCPVGDGRFGHGYRTAGRTTDDWARRIHRIPRPPLDALERATRGCAFDGDTGARLASGMNMTRAQTRHAQRLPTVTTLGVSEERSMWWR
jgi:hypothetical protein